MGRPLGHLAWLLAIAFPALPTDVRLTGRVTDENNAPVPGARVSLKSDTTHLEATADPTGAFAFDLPAPGDYSLGAERDEYFAVGNYPVQVQGGANEISLVMNHVQAVFESVNVVASPPGMDPDKTASEHVLTGSQILEVPYPTSHNLRNAMVLLPNVMQDSAGGIHIAGGAEDQVLYTLDGFNITDPLTGRFESRLSVEAVRSLEVSTGRFAAELGKGSAGTLAVKTTNGDDKLRYSGTNFVPGVASHKGLVLQDWVPRFNLSGPIVKGRAWFSDSLDAEFIDHVVEELPKGQDRTRSWRWSNLLHNQINLTPSNILYTGFLVNYFIAPRTGLSALDPPQTTVDQRSRQWFFHIKDQVYFTRGALIEAGFAANRTFGREIPQGSALYVLTPEGRQGNYFVDATREAGRDQAIANLFLPAVNWNGAHQIKVGIDLDRLNYWQDARRTGYEHYREDGTLLNRVVFGGNGEFRRSNFEASSYVQDSWKMRANLSLDVGLRQDWDEILRNISLSPRFGFAWEPHGLKHTKISGGYAIIYDATNLRLFTRPLDQYSIATSFARDGSVSYGPAVSQFRIGPGHLATPRYQNWSLGLEQRLPGNLYLRTNYLRRLGGNGFTYANASPPGAADFVYTLGNQRRDVYDSVEIMVRQVFRQQYEWMASYTRSRAFSNAVVDLSIDDPIIITNNVGRMPWDAPNRLVTWGLLPTPRKNWVLSYLLETRTGFPFSAQDEEGRLVGALNSFRYPAYFALNLHIERRFTLRGNRWAWRVGSNNITNHQNPNLVNNNTGSAHFMSFYGSQGRTVVLRIRWLGKEEKTP